MKRIILFLLLSCVVYAQPQKSVFTQKQIDSLNATYVIGKTQLASANTYKEVLRLTPVNTYNASWSLSFGEVDFVPTNSGVDVPLNIGYNWSGSQLTSQFGMQLEPNYEMTDTTSVYEWFLYYNSLPSPSTLYSIRPLQVGIFKYGTTAPYNYTTSISTNADVFAISSETNNSLLEIRTQTYGATGTQSEKNYYGALQNAFGNSMLYIQDSLWIFHNINNMRWLWQANNVGSAKELLRIDNNNRLLLAPSTDTPIDFQSSIYGTIYWTDEAGTGEVPIYKETGTNRIFIGGSDGMVTNKLEVTNIPQDTTGLDAGQFYIDDLTGSVQYTMPENIFTDGTFTNWTGVSKARLPNNWIYNNYADTTGTYVEENPTGQMHFISDGSIPAASIKTTDSSVVGKTYGYSFTVSQITDTLRMYICDGTAELISATGVYSGVSDVISVSVNFVNLYGSDDGSACEITLDDIRVWEVGGNIDAPTYNVPTILDSLGNIPDTTGVTDGYVIKYVGGERVWSPDISTAGAGTFNPDGVTIDTTAGGLARVLPAKVTKWDSVSSKANTASFAIAPALIDDSIAVKMNRAEMTSYSTTSHTHIDFFDTLSITWGVLDTTYTGSLSGWKVPNDITITEISAYTDANTCTFNLEERAETTPNSAGTDVMASDLVADDNQQEQTSFTNATIAKNTWLVPTISATGDVAIFSISVRYIKTD